MEKEVQDEIENEKLRRTNPEAWRKKVSAIVPAMRPSLAAGPLQGLTTPVPPRASVVTTAPPTPAIRPPTSLNRPIVRTPGSPPLPAPSTLPKFSRPTFGQASLPPPRPTQLSAAKAPAWLSTGQSWSQSHRPPPVAPLKELPANKALRSPGTDSDDETDGLPNRAKQVNVAGPRPSVQKPIKDPYASSGRPYDQRRKQIEQPRLKQLHSFGTQVPTGENKLDRGRVRSESHARSPSTQQGHTQSNAINVDDSDAD